MRGETVQIRLSGSGGQGLQLTARLLAEAALASGWRVAHSQGYEPTSRGGLSRSDLVLSRGVITFPLVTRLDILVILDQVAVATSISLLDPDSVVIVDAERVPEPPVGPFRLLPLPFSETARRVGNERVANVVSLGALLALRPLCAVEVVAARLRAEVPAKLMDLNLDALEAGLRLVAGERCGVGDEA